MKRTTPLPIFLLIIAVAFAVYGNTFANDWTYDDVDVVVNNPDARSLGGFLANRNPGRPLRELSYIPEHLLFGDRPAGYHLQQILWHGGNGALLFLVARFLGIGTLSALIGALFFLVHPLQAESLANISHRKELLALFFSLAGLLVYLHGLRQGVGRRRWHLAGAAGCYLLALLANLTSVTMVLVALLYEWLLLERPARLLARRPWMPLAGLAAAAGLFVWRFSEFFTPAQLLKVYSKNNFIASDSYLPHLMGTFSAFVLYLQNILLPLNLAPEYVIRLSENIWQPRSLTGLALLAVCCWGVLALRRREPLLAFGLGTFLCLYLPVANFIPVAYLAADRYLYLPLAGLALVVGRLHEKFARPAVTAAVGFILVALAALTVAQNRHWRNEHTLWRHAAQVNADSTWAQQAAARSYLETGDYRAARDHARRALAVNRFNPMAYLLLARAEEGLGNLPAALEHYELFQSVAGAEFPQEVAQVRQYLPQLRQRLLTAPAGGQ